MYGVSRLNRILIGKDSERLGFYSWLRWLRSSSRRDISETTSGREKIISTMDQDYALKTNE